MKLIITFLLLFTSICFSQAFWEPAGDSLGGYVKTIAINLKGHIYAGTSRGLNGNIGVGAIYRSIDNGDNWTKINNGLPNNTPGNYFTVRTLKTGSNQTILAGTGNGYIYRSIDNGVNWSQLDFEINAHYDQVRALEINSSGHIFAGTYGGIFRSIDNGESWVKLDLDLPTSRNGYVRALDINSNGYIFAAVDHYVFRSKDNGDNWAEVAHFGGWGIESLVITSQDCIFAGVDGTGVYCSTDDGDNWTQLYSGLTDPFVYSLALNSNDYIFVGTNHGLVFRSRNPTTSNKEVYEVPIIFSLEQNYPNPFNPSTKINYSIPKQSNVTLKVFDVLGREVATIINKVQPKGNYEVTWAASNQPSGIYFYKLTAGASAGSAIGFVETKKMILIK